jgi:ABC-type lipoprotein release transport system permease subunit
MRFRLRFRRSETVDYGNRTLLLPGRAVGILDMPGRELLVPVRALRFVRAWRCGKATFETDLAAFAGNRLAQDDFDRFFACDVYATDADAVDTAYRAILDLGEEGYRAKASLGAVRRFDQNRTLALGIFGLVILLTFLITVVSNASTFWADAVRRTRDIAYLRALGAPRSSILWVYLLPGQMLGLISAIAASALGYGAVMVLRQATTTEALKARIGIDLTPFVAIRPWMPVALAAIACLFCLLGCLPPAFRASRLSVARALRHRG